ncbi:MAG: DUF1343 domain-containing protein [Flavobacteriales bacterium]|nr:DUF1343 domain-containing protein [Flavobacteriales bacterium]
MRLILTFHLLFLHLAYGHAQQSGPVFFKTDKVVKVGAVQVDEYLYDLQEMKVGVVANQSSLANEKHLVDLLIENNVNLVRVFSPEHGFRGTEDAGKKIGDQRDEKTGLKIISLYGKNKKPNYDQIIDLDVIVFDLQDVGVRYYTYISTMFLVMQACAEMEKKMIVLDRPNPNGFYVDGPVLDPKFSSFVGMHEVPLVHGMTIGEYARMINGEGWLGDGLKCNLKVITCKNYDHNDFFKLRVKPSPNLPNMSSIFLYPSLGLFEGTVVSVGRGTDKPFQQIGHPKYPYGDTSFVPKSVEGARTPKLMNEVCYGFDLEDFGLNEMPRMGKLYLHWLINMYESIPDSANFFLANGFFDLLAGTDRLRLQIIEGKKEKEIRASWQEDLVNFKGIRKKYLLYDDFE